MPLFLWFAEEDEAGGREAGSGLPCPEMVGGEGGAAYLLV